MTAAHYKGGHHPGNDLGFHYTALPPIVASCPYSDQLLVTRKFWSPGANRPSQAKSGSSLDDLIANGTADTFEAAKAAALFEARARYSESGILTHNVVLRKITPLQSGTRPARRST